MPNDKILNILREEIKRLEPSSKGFIIDGYPREDHQGPAFEKAISPVSVSSYKYYINSNRQSSKICDENRQHQYNFRHKPKRILRKIY